VRKVTVRGLGLASLVSFMLATAVFLAMPRDSDDNPTSPSMTAEVGEECTSCTNRHVALQQLQEKRQKISDVSPAVTVQIVPE
jgi:hypothetical protein